MSQALIANSNRYADEEVPSNYTYPKEYRAKPINDQIKAIAEIFDLDPNQALKYAKNLPQLPEGAEGWFAVPSVDAIAAKHFPEIVDDAEKYCCAVQLVHEKIAESRSYRAVQITWAQLRVSTRTTHALDLVAEKQTNDVLIIAAQLGMRHRGRSVRRAREVFVANEFGLTSFMVGSIVLIHPERLAPQENWERLSMNCSGDEFHDLDDDVRFSYEPTFNFFHYAVEFGACYAYDLCASASGFLPTEASA